MTPARSQKRRDISGELGVADVFRRTGAITSERSGVIRSTAGSAVFDAEAPQMRCDRGNMTK